METRTDLAALGLDGSPTHFVLLGEAGSGKSELAINLARLLTERSGRPVHFFDLDMTKPLFRIRDQRDVLAGLGIHFHFEDQFMDAPTAAGGVSRLLRDESCHTILDVGGDYIGARAVGMYAPLLNHPRTAVLYVMNPYRPWSASIEHIDQVLAGILGVSHIRLDQVRLAGNPNLGPETTAEDVLAGCRSLSEMVSPYKPLDFFCAEEGLFDQVKDALPIPCLPIRLYLTYPWNQGN